MEFVARRIVAWTALCSVAGLTVLSQALSARASHGVLYVAVIVASCTLAGLAFASAERSNSRRKTGLEHALDHLRRLDERFIELATIQHDVAAHAGDPDSVRLIAVDRALRLTGADDARIWMIEGAKLRVAAAVGRSSTARGTTVPIARNLLAFAVHTVSVVVTADAQNDSREDVSFAKRSGIRSLIAVPLMLRGEAVGVLSVAHGDAGRFDTADVETTKMLAGHLTSALALADEMRRTHESIALQQTTIDAIEAGVVYYDSVGRVGEANASASRILRGRLELVGDSHDHRNSVHVDERGQALDFAATYLRSVLSDRIPRLGVVAGIRFGDDDLVWLALNIRPLEHERYAAIASFTDITSFKGDAERQRHLAEHDVLTGLPNAKSLKRQLQSAIDDATAGGRPVSVLYVDLNGFKNINDTFGHAFGDETLAAAANRMRALLRPDDVLARIGGDEFAAVVRHTNPQELGAAQNALTRGFAEPLVIRNRFLSLAASIGVASHPSDGATAQELLDAGDARMYAHKGRVIQST